MGLSDLYYKLEEKHYALLDWFDSKGMHFPYKIDNWLQEKNINPVVFMGIFNILVLCLIIFLILFFTGVVGHQSITANLYFIDTTNNVAVPNLEVKLSYGNDYITETTDYSGYIKMRVPKNEIVSLKLLNDNYILDSIDQLIFEEDSDYTIYVLDSSNLLSNKILTLYKDEDTTAMFSELIELNVSCNEIDYNDIYTVNNGTLDLTNLPNDCKSIHISSEEYNIEKDLSLNGDLTVVVDSEKIKGNVSITVENMNNEILPNMEVSAYFVSNDNLQGQGYTDESGTINLELPANKEYYFIINDPEGQYSVLNTINVDSECNREVIENNTISCRVQLSNTNVGKLKVKVMDSVSTVNGAKIIISKNNYILKEYILLESDKGLFELPVSELGEYNIVVDDARYMYYNSKITVSDVPLNIILQPVKDNVSLTVNVTANDEISANATVKLYKDEALISTKLTGAEGSVVFDRLESNVAYYVVVNKGDYSQTSTPLILDIRQINKINVNLIVGRGNVDVSVLDLKGLPITNLSVDLYDLYSNKKVSNTTITDELGIAHFYGISADKTVYAKAYSDTGASYSLFVNLETNQTVNINTYFTAYNTNLSFNLLGIYNADGSEITSVPYNVLRNNEYYAVFVLNVPKTAYSEGELFFLGNAVNLGESDVILKDVEVVYGSNVKGTTYNYPNGYATDVQNKTNDDALWIQSKLSKINAGATLVKVKFSVNDSEASLFRLNYRAMLKAGSSFIRLPLDTVLGQSESVSEKMSFYANTLSIPLKSGDLICKDIACIDMTATDDLVSTKVYDELYSSYNTETNFNFNLINAKKTNFTDLKLVIDSTNALDISSVVGTLNNTNIKFEKSGTKYIAKLSEFNQNAELIGNFKINTTKTGNSILKIGLESNKSEILFEQDITVSVENPYNLTVDLYPKVIVPFVNNTGYIEVKSLDDNSLINNAKVNLYLNDTLLSSGKTNDFGQYSFEIQKPNVGDTLKINVSAPSYNVINSEIKINENILISSLPEIIFSIDKENNDKAFKTINLSTPLPYKLKITKFGFVDNSFGKYMELKTNLHTNMYIDGNIDLDLNAKLTELGENLLEPKSFTTYLDLVLTSEEVNTSWNAKIPLNIYIKLGDSLDFVDCLTLKNIKDDEYNLINNCNYNANPVKLNNVKIFVEWDGKELGKYTNDKLEIKEEGLELFEVLKTGNNNFDLNFKESSDVISETSKVIFTIKAYYPTNNGLQEITTKLEKENSVSDLSRCLQIISSNGTIMGSNAFDPVILGVQNYQSMLGGYLGAGSNQIFQKNLMLSMLGGYLGAGSNPLTGGSIANDTVTDARNTYGSDLTGTGNYYALNGFAVQLPTTNTIQIRNNCNSSVNVEVKPDSQITISGNSGNIAPNSSMTVTLQSSFIPGVYNARVLAGFNNNLNSFMIVPVHVQDYFATNFGDKCIELSTGDVLKMNDFINKHKEILVYNFCYSKGAQFNRGDPIDVSNFALNEDVVLPNNNNTQEKIISKGTSVIRVSVTGSPEVRNDATHGYYQVLRIYISKSIDTEKLSNELFIDKGSVSDVAKSITSIRQVASELNQTVNLPTVFTANLNVGKVNKLIEVQDFWKVLGATQAIEKVMDTLGIDKKTSSNNSGNSNSSNSCKLTSKIDINYDGTNKEITKTILNGCNNDFKLKEGLNFSKEGLIINLIPNGQDLTIKIEGTTSKSNININVTYNILNYVVLDNKNESNTINININIINKNSSGSSGSGTSGNANLENYGFGSIVEFNLNGKANNMISYNYENINCENNFCDAEQLKTYLKDLYKSKVNDIPDNNFNKFLDINYYVKIGKDYNVPVEVSAKDYLDKLTLYSLEKDLNNNNLINDNKLFSDFNTLENLYLKVHTTETCMDSRYKKYAFTIGKDCISPTSDSNPDCNCYYSVKKMIDNYVHENANLMAEIFGKDSEYLIDAIFLIDKDHNYYYGFTDEGKKGFAKNSKLLKVYLKPDNYKDVFNNTKLGTYSAKVLGVEKVEKPGAYVVYPFDNANKKLIIDRSNYYYNAKIKDTLKMLMYNFSVDPSYENYGVCVSKGELKISITETKTIFKGTCNGKNLKQTNNSDCKFNLSLNTIYELKVPNNNCTLGNISVSVDKYYLKEMFEESKNYKYTESNNNLNIEFVGIK